MKPLVHISFCIKTDFLWLLSGLVPVDYLFSTGWARYGFLCFIEQALRVPTLSQINLHVVTMCV